MNPALLQNPYHIDYSLNTDNKYLSQDRTFPGSHYQYISRKAPNGLNNAPLGQTLSVPTNTGLGYNPHPSIPEASYPQSPLLLSPPSSIDDSHTTSVHPASSSFNFSGTSKSATSNASSTVPFPTSLSHYASPLWSDTTMTDLRGPRPSVLHPQLSPPLSYGHPGSTTGQFFGSANRALEQYPNSYSFPRSFNGPDMHHGIFNKHTRSPTFNALPMPMSSHYSVNNSYTRMPSQQPVGRPEGPPFEETKILQTLISRNQSLGPEISASIQKGFFQVDGKWTCYRRNYFTVSCAFTFKSGVPDGPVYLQRHSQLEPVQQYAVSISAKTANGGNQESESRQLVQHTPKRDKATESVPGRHLVQPAPFHSLQSNGVLPAASMYGGGQHVSPGMIGSFDGFGTQGHLSVPTSFTFERIQFQKATANNGKRRAQQQYFHVVVELSVNVGRPGGEDSWIVVATRQSHPMVVRGRSPGHYKDNVRRDGQTNMDHDRGNGPGGDGGPINLPMPFIGGSSTSSMDWAPSHRQGHHYGSSYTRYSYQSDCSPHSASSSTTLTASPAKSEFQLSDLTISQISSPYDCKRPVLTSVPVCSRDQTVELNHQFYGRKRPYEDNGPDYEHDFYNNNACTGKSFSPRSFDFAESLGVRPVRAS